MLTPGAAAALRFVVDLMIGLLLAAALIFAAWPQAMQRALRLLIWHLALRLATLLRRAAFAPLGLSRGMGALAQRLDDWAFAAARRRAG